ncbi:MAG: isoleucine--tRNA ligase [Holosporaceae bacterium]|nr:isoleucine--tRNA ligase [Holosporaceae bacterium]
MNFKDTIFLPETDFQMRANLSKKEPEILESWNGTNIYEKMLSISRGRKEFILHDGPPFANGNPHAGTAMNKIVKDMINRLKRMQGFRVPFVPGWDCHGLPIEWKVQEQLKAEGKKKEDISVVEFRNMCKEFALRWIDVQREGFKRLGIVGDWENPYLTMSPKAEAAVIRQIGKFITDGTLYRGEKPVFWSVVEQTALADAEIEYIDKKSASIYVSFGIKSSSVDFLKNAACVIWTTTPWTIPGNRALAFSEGVVYCLLGTDRGNFVAAKDLAENFLQTTGIAGEILREFGGELLKNTICRHPLCESGYDFDVPLIHGDHVDTETGTGLVHLAPGHGVEDFRACKKHDIAVPITVNEAGIYHDCVPVFAGKHIFKVEEEILSELEKAGTLLFRTSILHSYPHSWRSKAPLIFRTTPQWFIGMDNTGLRQKALKEIGKVKWIPKQGQNRITAFVENRGDWCISRQRVWGVPLPLFTHRKTGEPLRDPDVIGRIADIFELEGSDAWFIKDPQVFLGDKYKIEDYEQVKDTMDVWFESASTYAYVLKKDDSSVQADMYVEGSDQHRGWFQHSLLNSCGVFGNSPFKSVMTHGFIVDEQGRKMSKSLGNVVTLEEVVKNFGADIFRMWVASSDFTRDLKLGKNILKQLEDVYRKLRNTLRYISGALAGYDSSVETVPCGDMPDLERWILHRLTEIHEELMSCIECCDVNRYFATLHTFCSGDLSSFFFDVRKDCLYCDRRDDPKRKAYRCVLNALFHYLVRWLAPIVVFTAEEAWTSMYGSPGVHLEDFLVPDKNWVDPQLGIAIDDIKKIRKIVTTALEAARREKIIGSSLQASVTVFDPDGIIKMRDESVWEEIAITSGFKIIGASIPADAFVDETRKNIGVRIIVAEGEKCERCWKVSKNAYGDKICERCRKVSDLQN